MIKRIIAINVPIKSCNLKCNYCYISALGQFESGSAEFRYSPEHVARCLSEKRLGGTCIINLTGGGETLIPPEMPSYIRALLEQGHFLEVVTNGTMTKRFEEIATFPKYLLERLEFKFSFHYLELKRLNMLGRFVENVNLVREKGCSITIECTPTDELEKCAEEIRAFCIDNFGAVCHLTIARNDVEQSKGILSDKSFEEYCSVWERFDSKMFEFKKAIFQIKRHEFCYAGCWSLYVDLGTGMAKPCYGQMYNQNIFQNPEAPIIFEPVGKHCRQPYCYNGHAYLALGCIPELKTPSYSEIRNRVCRDGSEWEQEKLKSAFSEKLMETNDIWNEKKIKAYERKYFFRLIKTALYDWPEIFRKIEGRFLRKK